MKLWTFDGYGTRAIKAFRTAIVNFNHNDRDDEVPTEVRVNTSHGESVVIGVRKPFHGEHFLLTVRTRHLGQQIAQYIDIPAVMKLVMSELQDTGKVVFNQRKHGEHFISLSDNVERFLSTCGYETTVTSDKGYFEYDKDTNGISEVYVSINR